MATRPSSDQACRHGERSREESVIFLIQVDRRSRHSLVSLHPSLLQRRHEVHSLSSCLAPMKETPGKSRTSAPTSQSRHQHPPTSELRVTLEKTPQDLLCYEQSNASRQATRSQDSIPARGAKLPGFTSWLFPFPACDLEEVTPCYRASSAKWN